MKSGIVHSSTLILQCYYKAIGALLTDHFCAIVSVLLAVVYCCIERVLGVLSAGGLCEGWVSISIDGIDLGNDISIISALLAPEDFLSIYQVRNQSSCSFNSSTKQQSGISLLRIIRAFRRQYLNTHILVIFFVSSFTYLTRTSISSSIAVRGGDIFSRSHTILVVYAYFAVSQFIELEQMNAIFASVEEIPSRSAIFYCYTRVYWSPFGICRCCYSNRSVSRRTGHTTNTLSPRVSCSIIRGMNSSISNTVCVYYC